MKNSRKQSKRLVYQITCFALASLISLISTTANAAIPPSVQYLTYVLPQSSFVRQESKGQHELDLSYIQRLSQLARRELKMSVADFVPSNMSASDSDAAIARQIIGHSIERWFSSSEIAQGSIGVAIRGLEEPLSPTINSKDSSGMNHKVQFNMKVTRAIASVTYTGYVEATMAYQATSQTLAMEVSRRINDFQKVVLSHTSQPEETRQVVAWQMSW